MLLPATERERYDFAIENGHAAPKQTSIRISKTLTIVTIVVDGEPEHNQTTDPIVLDSLRIRPYPAFMIVKQFRTGGDRNFGYLVVDEDEKKAAAIDPSYNPEMIVQFARENGYEILYVLNTHGHSDHSNGNQQMRKLTGRTALQFGGVDPETGVRLGDNSKLPLGNLEIQIIHTPGHTEDSMCILVSDALFTGDTLFVGKVGGTDLGRQAKEEYDSLHKLLSLSGRTRVFPGHDCGTSSESTIDDEKRANPFLLQPDFDSFVHLKQTWTEYKREHGIA